MIAREKFRNMKATVQILALQFILTVGVYGDLLVRIDSGLIRGRLARSPNNITYYAFQEIPYAAPPIGNLRFRPPQPVARWNDVLSTTENTKICHQTAFDSDLENEDCLYLNVYTPRLPRSNRDPLLAVMFHIHGGGFFFGDGTLSSLGPDFLIEEYVVIVTLNYRLGAFGFLSTQDEVIPGNDGLKDQQFALKWVNRNIRLFGGDPSAVTILGQSAGAASVAYHLLNPRSSGLFRAAVIESGSALSAFAYQRNARYYAYKTALTIDPSFDTKSSSKELLRFFLNVPASELDIASSYVINSDYYMLITYSLNGIPYAPVLEYNRREGFVLDYMFETVKRGGALRVPLLIGITSEEFVETDPGVLRGFASIADNDTKLLVSSDMNLKINQDSVGREIRRIYVGNGQFQDSEGLTVKFFSDSAINRGTIMHAFLQKTFSDVYFYEFSYDGPLGQHSAYIKDAGHVAHLSELVYLWRMNNYWGNNYNLSEFPNRDLLTQKRLISLWTNFVKNLNPTPTPDKTLQYVTWPKASAFGPANLAYLDIGDDLRIKNNPKGYYINSWNRIYSLYGKPPFDTY